MSLIVVASCLAREGVPFAGTLVSQPEVFISVCSWVFEAGREAEVVFESQRSLQGKTTSDLPRFAWRNPGDRSLGRWQGKGPCLFSRPKFSL